MELDYSPRASGKTTRMIEWLREDDKRLLITFSHDEENRLKRLYPDMAVRIYDWHSYQTLYRGHAVKFTECAIDNVELILQKMVNHPLTRISISEAE